MQFNFLKKKFINNLRKKKIKICIAESITGGFLSSELVKIPNASEYLEYSIVSYSLNSKESLFNIKSHIKKYGVVSYEVAELMARKIRIFSKEKNLLSISCTGFAGPASDKYSNLGTVYIAAMYLTNLKVIKKKIKSKDRKQIIRLTALEMIKISNSLIS